MEWAGTLSELVLPNYIHTTPKYSAYISPVHVSDRQITVFQHTKDHVMNMVIVLAIQCFANLCAQRFLYSSCPRPIHSNQQVLLRQRPNLCHTRLMFITAFCLLPADIWKLHSRFTSHLKHPVQNTLSSKSLMANFSTNLSSLQSSIA